MHYKYFHSMCYLDLFRNTFSLENLILTMVTLNFKPNDSRWKRAHCYALFFTSKISKIFYNMKTWGICGYIDINNFLLPLQIKRQLIL